MKACSNKARNKVESNESTSLILDSRAPPRPVSYGRKIGMTGVVLAAAVLVTCTNIPPDVTRRSIMRPGVQATICVGAYKSYRDEKHGQGTCGSFKPKRFQMETSHGRCSLSRASTVKMSSRNQQPHSQTGPSLPRHLVLALISGWPRHCLQTLPRHPVPGGEQTCGLPVQRRERVDDSHLQQQYE